MNKGKNERNGSLMKQGKGLAALSVCLLILALLLIAVWVDQSFVPWGDEWTEIKAYIEKHSLINYSEDWSTELGDGEMWETIKEEMVSQKAFPIKSGFVCWGLLRFGLNREKAHEAEWEKQMLSAQEAAEAIKTVFDEFLFEKGVSVDPPQNVRMLFWAGSVIIGDGDELFSDEDENDLSARLLEAVPSLGKNIDDKAAAQVFLFGDKCTAAAYAPMVSNIYEGLDFPNIDENGCFDSEDMWSMGWSEARYVGYIDENGVKADTVY
ncbi:MAG: hypothetical protein NC394_05395 [Bacteroides sp.]|nr:hypothetical protein [Bacteroides sp.]